MPRSTKSIDSLSIEITANAKEANTALEQLIKNITTLGNALNGIDTKTFTNGIKDIGTAVKGVKLNDFQKQMTKMSKSMSGYASAVAKVARNTTTTTSGFAKFKNGLGSLQSGLTKVNTKIDSFASRMKRASKETKNFAQTVGLLYARFFLLIRGAKGLVNAVKSSMNYIEVLNYFDASFGQVAERGVAQWSDMGYESAQAYYDSFAERAKKVTQDMSGFFPEENGTLSKKGMASLGMNPQQLMQYQAQFAQMSSSMGTTSEQALKLSEVLTKIGADLASVKNMEFEDVWRDMASGLVGMSRTLDKYGVNIRNANMDMKLHELGINANVKSLSQADKALLRTIILLDSAKYGWADLAETLNTPANQFRMLTNNIKLLGQMIGNIFLPIVAKVLPYINAFVIALQRLFTWLAKILGIDLSGLLGKNTGYDNSGISDLLDDAEGVGDALDDDANSAKKLKRQLQGFDALNNLTTKEDSGGDKNLGVASGLLNDAFIDAVDEYLKAWQDAFDKIENRAEAIADKIVQFFRDITYPLRKAWSVLGDDVIESWTGAFESFRDLLADIGKDFMTMWHENQTIRMFRNILTVVKDLGLTIDNLSTRLKEAWNYNDTGLHIFENLRDIILIITEHIREMADATVEWSKKLNFTPLLSKMEEYLNSIKPVADAVWGAIQDFYEKALLPLGQWVLEKGLPDLVQVFIDFNNRVDWDGLREKLAKVWERLEPFAETVGEGIIIFIEKISQKLADFVNSDAFEHFVDKICEWMDNVTAQEVADFLEKLAWGIGLIKGSLVVIAGLTGLSTAVTAISNLMGVFGIGGVGGATVAGEIEAVGTSVGVLSGALEGLVGALAGFALVSIGWDLVDSKFFDVIERMTGQADVIDRMREKYEGLTGAMKVFKDGFGFLTGDNVFGIEGITSAQESYNIALEKLDQGFVMTNEQLNEVSKKFGWLEDDIQSYQELADSVIESIAESQNKIGWEGIKDRWKYRGNDIDTLVREYKERVDKATAQAVKSGSSTPMTLPANFKVDENAIKQAENKFKTAGYNLIQQVPKGANEGAQKYDSFKGAWNSFETSSSPSFESLKTRLYNKSAQLPDTISKGIASNTTAPKTAMTTLGDQCVAEYHKIDNKLYNASYNSTLQVKTGIQNATPNVVSSVNGLKSGLTSAFSGLSGTMETQGYNLMVGLHNGIIQQANSILQTVSRVANNIVGAFSGIWQIHSPSKVMDEMGVYFMEGLQNGIESMYTPIEQSVSSFGSELAQAPDLSSIGSVASFGNVSSSQTYNADNTETNSLLRQQNALLQAILEKEMGIDANDLFRSVQKSASSFKKQTGLPAFT